MWLYLFGDFSVVEGLEGDHLPEDLGGLEWYGIDFELEENFAIVCGEEEADTHGDDVCREPFVEILDSLVVFFRGCAAGEEDLCDGHVEEHLEKVWVGSGVACEFVLHVEELELGALLLQLLGDFGELEVVLSKMP